MLQLHIRFSGLSGFAPEQHGLNRRQNLCEYNPERMTPVLKIYASLQEIGPQRIVPTQMPVQGKCGGQRSIDHVSTTVLLVRETIIPDWCNTEK